MIFNNYVVTLTICCLFKECRKMSIRGICGHRDEKRCHFLITGGNNGYRYLSIPGKIYWINLRCIPRNFPKQLL